VSNVQLDDNIRVRLLEKEGFKSTPEAWKCWRRNNGSGFELQSLFHELLYTLFMCTHFKQHRLYPATSSTGGNWGNSRW